MSAYAAIEEGLEILSKQFDQSNEEPLNEFLDQIRLSIEEGNPNVHSYKPSVDQINTLIKRLDSLRQLAERWFDDDGSRDSSWSLPKPSASLRMFPREFLK